MVRAAPEAGRRVDDRRRYGHAAAKSSRWSSSSAADERFQAGPGYGVVSHRATLAALAPGGDSLGAHRAGPGCVAPPPVQSGEVEYDGRASGSAAPADHREPPR